MDDLNTEIKKNNKNSLALIDVRTLKLWKVGKFSLRGSVTSDFRKLSQPIPSAEIRMKVKLDQSPQEIPGCVKLESGDELSEHFSSVPRKHVLSLWKLCPRLRVSLLVISSFYLIA